MVELKEMWMQADDESGDSYGYDIEAGGEKIGTISCVRYADGTQLIERIDIDEDRRCHGYGTQAIKAAADMADGCTFIVPDNADASRLYDRIGWQWDRDDEWQYLDQGYGVYRV